MVWIKKFFVVRALNVGAFGITLIVLSEIFGNETFSAVAHNLGIALLSAGVALFLSHKDFEKAIKSKNFDDLGIKDFGPGYHSFISDGESLESFFSSCGRIKELDIVGIAMNGFIDQNRIIQRIEDKSKEGFQVRVIFADPKSDQVLVQSKVEGKGKRLVRDAQENISDFVSRFGVGESVNENVRIHVSKSVPRYFILRSGGKMIVTSYLLDGPDESVSYIYESRGGSSTPYEFYLDYINKLVEFSYTEKELKTLASYNKVETKAPL
ncbi:hypothetical protein [Pseudoalteromonas phenolica]|uniref:Uncharacterized protein n=1 Tax=Pseudoalteromonas phenolica TaxID=161398 RepID=A0A0S2K2D8_9GAMM|nr:hypothetical protein [Pseudoalteromonas phenolica]ALO42508.1 hypothetical protein PP2015_2010 [Pseudoalteromonas phenolica]MBE0356392.1 hypothetical protein [Pseudoalteromonas phenolica O-BC30]RXF06255.1 hypothetical protein D9981_01620 [Pseudoalteromonas phenolica O-BC30]